MNVDAAYLAIITFRGVVMDEDHRVRRLCIWAKSREPCAFPIPFRYSIHGSAVDIIP